MLAFVGGLAKPRMMISFRPRLPGFPASLSEFSVKLLITKPQSVEISSLVFHTIFKCGIYSHSYYESSSWLLEGRRQNVLITLFLWWFWGQYVSAFWSSHTLTRWHCNTLNGICFATIKKAVCSCTANNFTCLWSYTQNRLLRANWRRCIILSHGFLRSGSQLSSLA